MIHNASIKPCQTSQRARENHERIKYKLRLQGSSLAEIARELGISASAITAVGLGNERSRRIEQHLAIPLGESLCEAFPDRYRNPDDGQDTAKPVSTK